MSRPSRWPTRLAGIAAIAFWACTPLNAPRDGGAGSGGAGTTGGGGSAGGTGGGGAGTTGGGGSVGATGGKGGAAGVGGASAGNGGTTGVAGAAAGSGGAAGGRGGTVGAAGVGGASAGSGGSAGAKGGSGGAAGVGGASAGSGGSAGARGGSGGATGVGGASAGRGGSGGTGGSGGGCGRFTRGPTMSLARSPTGMFCIDTTEVTQGQYQAFLADKNLDSSGQAQECTWNVQYAPDPMCPFDPSGHASFPVNGVDWCDATAYCKWAGKRLCGSPNGGGLITTDVKSELAKAEVSEWASACTHGGLTAYPYGTAFDGQACNGGEHLQPPSKLPVGSMPLCVAGDPGIFDLVGNVHEWQNACYANANGDPPGRTDKCWFSGGAYEDMGSSCATAFAVNRDYVDSYCDIGIRCCADPG